MAKVIYGPSSENALITTIVQDYSVGTKIIAPKNHFGILNQLDGPKPFTDSVILNKKSLPWLREPKFPIFGKIKHMDCYFLPYGFSGTLYFDEEFTLKNNRKARMKLKFQYELQIQDAKKAYELRCGKFLTNYFPAKATGTLITFQDFKNAVGEHIKEHLRKAQADNAHWTFELKPGGRLAGLSFASIGTETSLKLFLTQLFPTVGYKANKINVDIEFINYV